MKSFDAYTSPSLEETRLDSDILSVSVPAGTWEGSVSDTGSNWGGTGSDDSQYGL